MILSTGMIAVPFCYFLHIFQYLGKIYRDYTLLTNRKIKPYYFLPILILEALVNSGSAPGQREIGYFNI